MVQVVESKVENEIESAIDKFVEQGMIEGLSEGLRERSKVMGENIGMENTNKVDRLHKGEVEFG